MQNSQEFYAVNKQNSSDLDSDLRHVKISKITAVAVDDISDAVKIYLMKFHMDGHLHMLLKQLNNHVTKQLKERKSKAVNYLKFLIV